MIKKQRHFALVASVASVALIAAGCQPEKPDSRPVSKVSVTNYDAELINAEARLYKVDENLQPIGEPIQTVTTDLNGRADFEISLESQYLSVVAGKTGYYIDEATGEKVQLQQDDEINALAYYNAGDEFSLTVSGFSHIASAYASCLSKNYRENQPNAVAQSTAQFGSMTTVNVFETVPVNPTLETAKNETLTKGLSYGILAAAVSQKMKTEAERQSKEFNSTGFRTFDFYTIAAKDIKEDPNCRLDGKIKDDNGEEKPLGIGTMRIKEDTYRSDLGLSALDFLKSERNKSGISPDQYMTVANALASAESQILFGGKMPTPLDDQPPVINFVDPELTFYSSISEFPVILDDVTGVLKTELYINDELIQTIPESKEPEFKLPTTAYEDGIYTIKIVATDYQYQKSEKQIKVNFHNSGASVSLISNKKTNLLEYPITVQFNSPSGISRAEIDGNKIEVEEDLTASSTITLHPGINEIPVIAIDGTGIKSMNLIKVYVDRIAPRAIIETPDDRIPFYYSAGDGTRNTFQAPLNLSKNNQDALYYDPTMVSLEGLLVEGTALKNEQIPHIEFSVRDDVNAQPYEVITAAENIKVTLTYMVEDEIIFKDKELSPTGETGLGKSNYLIPFTKEYLNDDFFLNEDTAWHRLTFTLTDESGNFEYYDYYFKIRYFPEEGRLSYKPNDARYSSYSIYSPPEQSQQETAYSVEFINDNPYPVLVKLTPSQKSMEYTVVKKEGIRENKIRKHIINKNLRANCLYNGSNIKFDSFRRPYLDEEHKNIAITREEIEPSSIRNLVLLPNSTTSEPIYHNSDVLPSGSKTTKFIDLSHLRFNKSDLIGHYTAKDFGIYGGLTRYEYLWAASVKNNNCILSNYIVHVNMKGESPDNIRIPSNAFEFTELVNFSYEEGYPKNSINSVIESKNLDTTITIKDVMVDGFKVNPNEEGYFLVPEGSKVDFSVKNNFPQLDLSGNDCDWNYSFKKCDSLIEFSIDSSFDFNITPYVQNKKLPISIYHKEQKPLPVMID